MQVLSTKRLKGIPMSVRRSTPSHFASVRFASRIVPFRVRVA